MACLPGKAEQSPEPKQGILGFVYLESGNRMPMKGAEQQGAKGLSTTIYIYEATRLDQVSRVGDSPFYTSIHTRLVTTVHSDSTGSFSIGLAPGAYSLFTKQADRFYANAYDAAGHIAPVSVEKGKYSKVKITVNSSASY